MEPTPSCHTAVLKEMSCFGPTLAWLADDLIQKEIHFRQARDVLSAMTELKPI